MVGCVGDDALADAALALLREASVDVSNVMVQVGETTGTALIAVSPEGENQITVASGANACVGPSDAFNLPDCDAVLCQLEVPVPAVMGAMAAEKDRGLFAVNLAPAKDVPETLLRLADVLIVNQVEAAFYGQALHTGKGIVALTLGGDGAVLLKAGQEIARAPAFDVEVVDTTGAGDTFCGALMVALAEEQLPQDALRFASAAAALAVTKPGAQPSLPYRKQVDAFLARS